MTANRRTPTRPFQLRFALLTFLSFNVAQGFVLPPPSSNTIKFQKVSSLRETQSDTLDRLTTKTDTTTSSPSSLPIDKECLSQLSTCTSGTTARKVLNTALFQEEEEANNNSRLYNSIQIPREASTRPTSDADLAIATGIRNAKFSIMELIELNGDKDADRASLALLCVFVGSTFSALVAEQSLPGPEILRFAVVWLFSFAPLIFVGYGIATPAELQTLLVSVQRNIFPTYRKRMVQHEAGHFLIGHLLGLPIKGYRANAVKNAVEFYPLSDADVGLERAALMGFEKRGSGDKQEEVVMVEEKPFFSKDGRGGDALITQSVFREAKNYTANPFLQLPSKDNPTNSWPYRGFNEDTIDKLTVISVAGVCAEILAFGNAEGGYADISQLRALFASSEEGMNEKDMENRMRFALGYSMSLLRRHLGVLDVLADTMEKGGSVAECVLAIETCSNIKGGNELLGAGNYERARREAFRKDGVGFVERLLLGGGKNADDEDLGVIEGKGGGDRQKKFALTGDDPLYAAVLAAGVFFVWASNGGLSLH
mmetsp:Transcript_21656/g.31367  ORF Transcript_21656/g.31367 Transcript_21656/m.31367 type:complete len:540 (-) Transcript_21656:144-1763(-)